MPSLQSRYRPVLFLQSSPLRYSFTVTPHPLPTIPNPQRPLFCSPSLYFCHFPDCSMHGAYRTWPCGVGFLCSAYHPGDPSTLLGVPTSYSFSLLSSSHGVDVASVFNHSPVEDTWVASGLWLLRIKLPRTVTPRLCADMFSLHRTTRPGVQVPVDMVSVRLDF